MVHVYVLSACVGHAACEHLARTSARGMRTGTKGMVTKVMATRGMATRGTVTKHMVTKGRVHGIIITTRHSFIRSRPPISRVLHAAC